MIEQIKTYLLDLQADICTQLETVDGKASFIKDKWVRPDGKGSGLTRVLTDGKVFERAGVNYSIVHGDNMPAAATELRPKLAGCRFSALGVSLVIHAHNPYVPTSHANVRFFLAEKDNEDPVWWFGGGFDLTPYYGFDEDCVLWHQNAKTACAPFGDQVYARYKKWCDDYFYIKHRDEQRGIGGLFFDDVNEDFLGDFDTCFAFMRSVGDTYIKAYRPIVERRKDIEYGEREKQFQLYRRGRYVEFNLVYDRGTIFGLQTNGRSESILMSLPPQVTWSYQYQPKANTPEAKLYDHYLKPQDWVDAN